MGEVNTLKSFFTKLADAVKVKINNSELIKPTEIADKIQEIDSSKSGCFYPDLECYIPDGIKSVTSVIVSKDVSIIKANAYSAFTNLTDVVILGDNITEIKQSAFEGCSSLSHINTLDKIERVESYAFRNCSSLETFDFFDSLTFIGARVFDGSAWYKKQPSGVVYAGRIACGYKGEIVDGIVDFKKGTYGISQQLFYGDKNVISVTGYISNNVAENSFTMCTNLKSVELHQEEGEAVSLKSGSFNGCSSLEEVYFDNIRSIDGNSFSNCPKIKSICLLNKDASSVYEILHLTGLSVIKGNKNMTIYVADGTVEAWKTKLGNNGEGYNIALYSSKNDD